MKLMYTIVLFFSVNLFCAAQSSMMLKQYFDGEDTLFTPPHSASSLRVVTDTAMDNIWQIGTPQKTMFVAAATLPNALITDTINTYPTANTSSFTVYVPTSSAYGIQAIQWKQKIDFEYGKDGGIIQFSSDSGQTWTSVFDNPFTYNFYGFDSTNVDTLVNGEFAFTGTDSVWRDVWLCFDNSWLFQNNGVQLRFTAQSDTNESNQEGWMIDNFISHRTLIHTGIGDKKRTQYFNVYPNPSQDRLFIDIKKLNEFHIIEHMTLVDSRGRLIQEWKNVPTHFFIDTKAYNNGSYFLKIKTNKNQETIPFLIQR